VWNRKLGIRRSEASRVLTLAVNLSGSVAASRLAAMVATVVKAEPTTGDPLARMNPGYYEDLSSGQGAAMIAGTRPPACRCSRRSP